MKAHGRERGRIAFLTITLVVASVVVIACSTFGTGPIEDENALPKPDAANGAGDVGALSDGRIGVGDGDGATATDALDGTPPPTCAIDCKPGVCLAGKCQPYVLAKTNNDNVLGVATSVDQVFFTNPNSGVVRVVSLVGGIQAPTAFKTGELQLRTIQSEQVGFVEWAIRQGPPAIRQAPTNNGSAASNVSALDCLSFTHVPPNYFFCVTGDGTIDRQIGAAVVETFMNGASARFIHQAGPPNEERVVWSDTIGIRYKLKTAGVSTASAVLVNATDIQGLAVSEPWVYFIHTKGRVERIHVDGTNRETLFDQNDNGPFGDLAVNTTKRVVYWADDDSVMGLAVAP